MPRNKVVLSSNSGNNMASNVASSSTIVAPRGNSDSTNKRSCFSGCTQQCLFSTFFEYETPKVVTVQNVPLGILRLLLQILVVSFVVFYQLWYARGYQEFTEVEASVTTKVKGFSRSILSEEALKRIPPDRHAMYQRMWDESDYVIPPAENSAFFVMTNVVLTPNQTRTNCPEDHKEIPGVICGRREANGMINITKGICIGGDIPSKVKGHGALTGNCVESDREEGIFVCEVMSWCPVEIDRLPLRDEDGPLIPGAENYTVYIKNSVSFPRFGSQYHRNNMPRGICTYKQNSPEHRLCPIFRLGDIVQLAGGNFTHLAVKGGVIGIDITWNCDLDWDFTKYCLPLYSFRILDNFGWNFRHAHYHEENRRTLVKAYGLKFLVVIDGQASKFDLKNTVIVLVTGLGLLGLSTMFCDFILLNYSTDRSIVKEKKYETVDTTSRMLQSTLNIMSQTSHLVSMSSFRPPSRAVTSPNIAEENDVDMTLLRHRTPNGNGDTNYLSPIDDVTTEVQNNGRPQSGLSNLGKSVLRGDDDETSRSQPIININISSEL